MKINDDNKLYKNELINQDNKKTYFKWVKKDDLTKENLLPEITRQWSKTDGFDTMVLR